jgi:formylglycine-generating enzyme required for sulfatase activity
MSNKAKSFKLTSWLLPAALALYLVYNLVNEEEDASPQVEPQNPGIHQLLTSSQTQQSQTVTAPVPKPLEQLLPSTAISEQPPPPAEVVPEMGSKDPPQGFEKVFKVDDLEISLGWVEPGEFLMGSPENEQYRRHWENQHKVTITQGFWMGTHEVTQKDWVEMGMENKSYFKGEQRPVGKVSWEDAVAFCEKLNHKFAINKTLPEGYLFRLPTEAEWEFCCRAGTTTASAFGDAMSSEQANFDGRSPLGNAPKGVNRKQPMPVGSYPPNAWGFYDMHGNMWEWCMDPWQNLPTGSMHNPLPLASVADSRYRVAKGGSWYVKGWECRSTSRSALKPSIRYNTGIGLRVTLGTKLDP